MIRIAIIFALLISVRANADERWSSRLAIQKATTSAADVALHPGGIIDGQLTNKSGEARSHTPISLISVVVANRQVTVVSSTTSDKNGRFVFRSVRPGSYELRTNDGRRVVRLWAPGTAPPSAEQTVQVVEQSQVVRGQGFSPTSYITPADILFWGTVGVGTGVPIALAESGS